ncbi:MAG: M3 family oligoendopeptidase [Oscillospiraceae bacterium]|nr:M3 family oligoendopeptidase [Oscillospiraceae bacterium]
MKFSQVIYTRPDMDKLRRQAGQAADAIRNASCAEEAEKAYLAWDDIAAGYSTQMSICYIRHSVNTEDKYYSDEEEFFDENSPVFTEMNEDIAKALAESPFRPELEKRFSKVLFTNTDMFLRSFSPAAVPFMQQDNKLISEYEKLIASAQIDFEGEKRTISQLAPFKQSPDDDLRRRAWEAEAGFYMEHSDDLDRIYDQMVKVRTDEAKALGFENYIPLAYLNMTRNCYDADDIARFREDVVRYIVPIADRLYREQADRTGSAYPLKYSDTSLRYRDGNAKPCGTPEEILAAGSRFYHSLSPETGRFFDFMMENELMDVYSRKGKMQGGYCTELPSLECPFIFANFNGTQGDVEVVTHEAGHAFAAYVNRRQRPTDTMLPTIEACEIHSMTMEFFAYSASADFFGKDAEKFRQTHLTDALQFIPYGTMVDHFQHIVYEHPELTPSERIDRWKELTAVYMPWIDLDGSSFWGEGRAWQRQGHIYERPFYYIDYCLAQTVALEFWVLMQSDRKDAFDRYYKLVSLGGRETFRGLVSAAGLDDPFGGALRTVAEKAFETLCGSCGR